MGDDRKPEYDKYEMAPQSDPDPEKGEVRVADGTEKKPEQETVEEWGGLNKEELLAVADTPFWNWTRNILLVLFWVAWLAMLVAAIIIVVRVPRCPEVEWWEKSVFYRVLPQSFKDSDGDGYGDLKGLESKLDYIKGIGADVLYLSSIYEERKHSVDLGQDIVNFTNVDSKLGTLADFEDLIAAAEKKELKVILEFVPNHSSDDHPWFQHSRNRTGNFTDYYIWRDCGDGSNPPNEELNKYGSSAWTFDSTRGQCYYHYLLEGQPDLNYENINVQMAIEEAMQFWFKNKVDGLVFSGVDYIFQPNSATSGNRRRRQADNDTTPAATGGSVGTAAPQASTSGSLEPKPASEPMPTSEPAPDGGMTAPDGNTPYTCVGSDCSDAQKKLHDLLLRWREVFNKNSYLGKYRLMVTETSQAPEMAVLQYGNDSREADLVVNLGFARSISGPPTGESINGAVSKWLEAKSGKFEKRWSTWVTGHEDISRIATRAGEKFARALNFILLSLPGAPITYYGEELATPDLVNVTSMDPVADLTSVASRDPQRGPMFWANTSTGNFTFANATPWLPLPSDQKYSVEAQEEKHGEEGERERSSLSVFKELAEVHREPSMTAGTYEMVFVSPNFYAFRRQFPDWPGYLVVTNFGDSEAGIDFEVKEGDKVITSAKFKLSSTGMRSDKGRVDLQGFKIKSGESVIFEI